MPENIKEIKAFGHKYKVKYENDCWDRTGDRAYIQHKYHEIVIDSNYPKSEQEESLLHEIMEIIKDKLQIDITHKDLSATSEGLYHILKENKLWTC